LSPRLKEKSPFP